MFKITMLVKKAPSITQQEFVAHWAAHSQKVLANQKALNIVRYAKTIPVFPEGQAPSVRRRRLATTRWASYGMKACMRLRTHETAR